MSNKSNRCKKARILVVENESIIAKDIQESLQHIGYNVCGIALTSKDAINKTLDLKPDLLLMDIMLNGKKDGIETAIIIREKYDIPIVYLTAYSDAELLKRAKKTEPYGYIIKPFDDRELQTIIEIAIYKFTTEKQLRESFKKLRVSLVSTVNALAYAVEMRDPYTAGHQRRVASLSCAIAKKLNLNDDEIEGLRLAALIHDIGKIHVPAEILSKPCKLTEAEFEIVQTHPQIGYDILGHIEFPWDIQEIILQHHERVDGSGYPQGLNDNKTLFEAQILAVADVVEAMLSHRPYRPAHDLCTTLGEIKKNKGILFKPIIVEVCIKLFEKKTVVLDNWNKGLV